MFPPSVTSTKSDCHNQILLRVRLRTLVFRETSSSWRGDSGEQIYRQAITLHPSINANKGLQSTLVRVAAYENYITVPCVPVSKYPRNKLQWSHHLLILLIWTLGIPLCRRPIA